MTAPSRHWFVIFASFLVGWSLNGLTASCSPMNAVYRSWRRWGCLHQNTRKRTTIGTGTLLTAADAPASGADVLLEMSDEEIPQMFEGQKELTDLDSEEKIFSAELTSKVKMWPPWPLNLLQRSGKSAIIDEEMPVVASNTYPSAAAQFWAYFKQRTRIGVRQIQEVGSQLWFHLPPAAPPLMLLASIPRKVITENKQGGEALSKRVVPLLSNPFARDLSLCGLGLAAMSWAHMELHRKRKLNPLDLSRPHESVSRVFLPPFLPEEVPEPEIEALQSAETASKSEKEQNTGSTGDDYKDSLSLLPRKMRKHLIDLNEIAPRRGLLTEWKRSRAARKREVSKIRRLATFDELVALQAIKRKSARSRGAVPAERKLGYALVTGASQGIGRAIAVELARWEIPLILVARDLDRLISLAYDLEACYGVDCCVLQADLSQLDAAEKIHKTTEEAGFTVDILVNNAGIAYEGLSVDMDAEEVERMILVNAMSYAKLGKLYGKDMKDRSRGRILMVSSMAGLTSASPSTALYGATKAFGKSLAFSMAKELEPYGVGVTCLMPGPVKNTQFRQRSGTKRSLCWYIPFYARPVEVVAHQGVISLLDGDTQVVPGWQNRVFVKIIRPFLPQRVETMCVQAAWGPIRLSRPRFRAPREEGKDPGDSQKRVSMDEMNSDERVHLDLKPRYGMQLPPRLLELPSSTNEKQELQRDQHWGNETEVLGPPPSEGADAGELATFGNITSDEQTGRHHVENIEELGRPGQNETCVHDADPAPASEQTKTGNAEVVPAESDSESYLQGEVPQRPQAENMNRGLDDDECARINIRKDEPIPSGLARKQELWMSPRLGPVDILEHREFVLPMHDNIHLPQVDT